jgi:NitT/TauT family transport system ATP-binding protein
MNVIEAEKVNIVFNAADKPVVALSDVDLTVAQGDFVSLIGPSGCGKTTLLRAIADLAPLTSGRLRVNGMSADEARRQRAYGYVFQAPALFPWRNVTRNVTLPLELTGMGKAEREQVAAANLALLGLQDFGKKFPWQLSGGMQQRVSIARALSFKPSLLLMDEPFGALDEITRDNLNLHVHELWRRTGMTSVFVTHSIPEAVFLSTRIVVMSPRPGRVLRVIESHLPAKRTLEMRDDPTFVAVAHEVREALREGHSYD